MDRLTAGRRAFRTERDQGRSASSDVLLLPSQAYRGGPGRAYLAHLLRVQHG